MYLYNYKGTIQLFKPHHLLEFEDGITILKSGKTTYIVNDIECVLIEDLVGTQLRLINILGIYRMNKNKMMTL